MTPAGTSGHATVTPLPRSPLGRHPAAGPDGSALLELAFDQAPVGLWMAAVATDGPAARARPVRVNRAFARMLDYSPDELVDRLERQSCTHPADVEADRVQLSLLAAGPPRSREWVKRFLHADGHVVWASVSAWRADGARDGELVLMGRAEEFDAGDAGGPSGPGEDRELVRMRALCGQLQHALDSRVIIEQAKGMVAAERRITVDQAFERIRRHSRSHSVDVHEVAAAVVNLGLIP